MSTSARRAWFFTLVSFAGCGGPGANADVEEVGAVLMDPVTHAISVVDGEDATNMSITLTALDAKSFAGDVITGGGGATTASGPIAGTVCPAFTIAIPK